MTNETTASQPILMAYVATDLDGHADVGLTIESAKHRAGPGCDTIIALHDISAQFVELEGKRVCAPGDVLASQPKSIGYDAQFLALMNEHFGATNWHAATNVLPKIITLIDSRAPAAQASATIQAAPDVLNTERLSLLINRVSVENRRDGWAAEKSYFGSADLARAAKAVENAERNLIEYVKSIAATIQEPVMVAEPGSQAQTSAATFTSVANDDGFRLALSKYNVGELTEHDFIEFIDGHTRNAIRFGAAKVAASNTLAAPMVADPAGVARYATDAEIAEWAERYNISNMLGNEARAAFEDAESLHQTYDAATVNAVPKIRITVRQARRLIDFFGGHDADVTVIERPADWKQVEEGLYAFCTEYPEDGAQFLGATEVDDELMRLGTVKAVPSEALDAALYRFLRKGFGDMGPDVDLHNAFVDGDEKMDATIDAAMKIAAPLADKTGGGE